MTGAVQLRTMEATAGGPQLTPAQKIAGANKLIRDGTGERVRRALRLSLGVIAQGVDTDRQTIMMWERYGRTGGAEGYLPRPDNAIRYYEVITGLMVTLPDGWDTPAAGEPGGGGRSEG